MKRLLAILPVLVGLSLIVGFVRLGQWQAGRAAYKEALFARFDRASAASPRPIAEVLRDSAPEGVKTAAFTPVLTGGRWLAEVSIYLENQVVDGRDGVHRFVPLEEADGTVRLVNLGWRPVDASRALPAPAPLPGSDPVAGLLAPPPATGLRLGELALAEQRSPFRVPWLDRAALEDRLNLELAPQILLATDESAVFRRQWRPATLPADRHRAYAFQWYALAAAVGLLTLWGLWRLAASALAASRSPAGRAPDGTDGPGNTR